MNIFSVGFSHSILAASTAAGSSTALKDMTLWELLTAGGWVMIPLFVISIIALALILFYTFSLNRSRVATMELRRALESLIREKNISGLVEAARANPQALARVVEQTAGFIQANPGADFATIREIAQAEGSRQATSLNQQVIYLMDVGVLAPMFGLFGTVVGILRSFGSIASDDSPMRTLLLAGGVSQALVATAAGLLIGITSMFFYAFFRGRVHELISELEAHATNLVAQMGIKFKN